MTLQLEYHCTEAERKEAQTLHLRQHYGGGSKWRARTVLFGLLALAVAALYFQFKTEIAPKDRLWVLGLAAVVAAVFLIQKLLTRRKSDEAVRLEISERELVLDGGNGRTVLPWTGFCQCIESPGLFVLVNRPQTILYTLPKRAFPDEAAQNWFRTQTMQLRNETAAATTDETFVPGRFAAANGISLTLQLKYRDYLSRNFTSWRMRGILLGILAFVIGIFIFTPAPPDAVNPPVKVLLIMLSILVPMLIAMFFVISFVAWRGERKFLKPQHIVLTSEGIEFADHDSSGRLAWSAYKYYQDGRWSFFVWHPRGSLWLMFPKRAFVTTSDLDQCRDLLSRNLKASRWFYL